MRSLDGRRIGPYELASCIGSGGMGVVYRAVDTRLNRTVAIKVLSPGIADDEQARERFDREGRAIAALNDPHICALYDIGETSLDAEHPDQTPQSVRFLVMEYLEGETLASRLTRGPIPVDEALRYAAHIASALERAHEAGIVHRDLKPGNIFLVPATGSSGMPTAKLLDFGLAKTATAVAAGDATRLPTAELTISGTMLGTLQYMAPEQIEGRPTDARTDVFAFGAMLFEMLTARKAFAGGDNQASLMAAILRDEPPALPPLGVLAPTLQAIVRRCLAKRPDDRWPSASDVLRELRLVRAAPPPRAGSASLTETRRIPRRLGIAGAVLIAAATILGVGRSRNWFAAAPPVSIQRATLAVLPLRSVDSGSESGHLGVGIADAIVTKLANVRSIRVRPTSAIASFDGRTIDPGTVARQLQVDHVLTGTMHRADDAFRFNLQLTRASDGVVVWGRQIDLSARGLFAVEDQVSAEVVAALQLEISNEERDRLSQRYTRNAEAFDEYLKGRVLLANYSDANIHAAMNHFERALQIDPNYGLAHAGLAVAAGIRSVRFPDGDQDAREWGRRASEYASRALARDSNLAEAHLALASAAGTLYGNFDWATVVQEADAALRLNPNLDLAHAALARAFYHLGQFDWSDLESARAEEISGGTNLEVSRIQVATQLYGGRFDEARALAERLLAKTEVPVVRQYYGVALFYLGERAKAIEVLAAVNRSDGTADPRSQASLAGILAASGRRDDAERTIRAVLDSGYMDHHVASALGAAEAQLGRHVDALKWLRQAADTGFPCYEWVMRDSLLDPIRSNNEFKTFIANLRSDHDRVRTRYQSVLQSY